MSTIQRLYLAPDLTEAYDNYYFLADKAGNASGVKVPVSDFMKVGRVRQIDALGGSPSASASENTAALEAGIAAGGVVEFGTGTYTISPNAGGILLGSNTAIRGQGRGKTVLRLKTNAGNFSTLFSAATTATYIENVCFENLTLDWNIENNSSALIDDGDPTTYQMLFKSTNCKNISIRGCDLYHSGVNVIGIGDGTDTNGWHSIQNNRFFFSRKAHHATNAPYYDNSCIYMDAHNYVISGNLFSAPAQDIAGFGCIQAVGAIEAHRGPGVVKGNVVRWYQYSCYAVAAYGTEGDISITGNTFTDCVKGVVLWSATNRVLQNVSVTGNTISVAQETYGADEAAGVELYYDATTLSDGDFRNIVVSNNTIRFEDQDRAFSPQKEQYFGGVQINPAGAIDGLTVTNNGIYNSPCVGINLIAQTTPGIWSNLLIANNMIIDAGANASAAGSYRSAIRSFYGLMHNCIIRDNLVGDTGATLKGLQSFYLFAAAGSTGLRYSGNTEYTASGTLYSNGKSVSWLSDVESGYGSYGVAVAGKCTAETAFSGPVRQTVFSLTLTAGNVLNLSGSADDGDGIKIFDFPYGRILVLGATINGSVTVNDVFNASPNDQIFVSCGTAAAGNDATLSGTEADLIPSTTLDTIGNTTLTLDWHAALSASAQFSNTYADGSPLPLYINAAVANAATTKAVTVAITGELTVTWVNLGNF